jgi:hypothetical protein
MAPLGPQLAALGCRADAIRVHAPQSTGNHNLADPRSAGSGAPLGRSARHPAAPGADNLPQERPLRPPDRSDTVERHGSHPQRTHIRPRPRTLPFDAGRVLNRSRTGRALARTAGADPGGAPQRHAPHHPGAPRRQHRRDPSMDGSGRTRRGARRARLLSLRRAHAVQGDHHPPARLRGDGSRIGGRTHQRGDLQRLHILLSAAAREPNAARHRPDRGHGPQLRLRSDRAHPGARGGLRGSAAERGQPAIVTRPPALQPALRGAPVRPSGAGRRSRSAGRHAGDAARLLRPLLRPQQHDPGGGRPGRSRRGAGRGRSSGRSVRPRSGSRGSGRRSETRTWPAWTC